MKENVKLSIRLNPGQIAENFTVLEKAGFEGETKGFGLSLMQEFAHTSIFGAKYENDAMKFGNKIRKELGVLFGFRVSHEWERIDGIPARIKNVWQRASGKEVILIRKPVKAECIRYMIKTC